MLGLRPYRGDKELLDEDSTGSISRRCRSRVKACIYLALLAMALVVAAPSAVAAEPDALSAHWFEILTPPILAGIVICLLLSGFFSGSETAFFSLHRLRLRALEEEGTSTGTLVARLISHPGRLLTTILVGNTIINILIGIFLGARVETLFAKYTPLTGVASFASAVSVTTLVLVFFGEVLPKMIAVRFNERFARVVAYPMSLADRLLAIPRISCLWITESLFRITRFNDLRAAPFITDDEFRAVLAEGEARNVIETGDLEMIQGILESNDSMLKEILVPRPAVTALPETATVRDAIELLRETEFSRVPMYEEDLDHVTGILVAKDMLAAIRRDKMDVPISTLKRPAQFVPQVMTVQQFVRDAQRTRTHLAVVVDEYGGTAGIVTLEDAMEEVVGDILDEGEDEAVLYEQVGAREYIVEGAIPLDDLSALIGTDMEDDQHETLGGFIMDQGDRIPEEGDTINHQGVKFTVVQVDGKRVESVRMRVPKEEDRDEESGQ